METKLAFVGFGEINTDRAVIERKCAEAADKLRGVAGELIVAGPVNDEFGYAQADEAVRLLKTKEFDALVLCVAGWIPTHAVIRVTDPFRHVPMLLWGLCGWEEEGRTVSTADQAGTTALRYAMQELGYRFRYVTSSIGEMDPLEKIGAFARAAGAARRLREARVGTMGYRDMLLYGTMFDGLSLRRVVGVEVEPFEMLEIYLKANAYAAEEIAPVLEIARRDFVFTGEVPDAFLQTCARYALAVAERVRRHGYGAVTLIDVDGMKRLLNLPPAFIFNLVDRLCDVCTIPENDVMGSVTQLMVRFVTGQIAPYAEFYEFFPDRFLMGVPDFIPRECTLGEAKIRPAKFGLLGTSLLNVSRFRDGRVTLCRLLTKDGKYFMHLFCGQASQPRRWEESGWEQPAPQLPSLEVVPDCAMEEFAGKVSSQHIIVAWGDHRDALEQLCQLLGVGVL